MNEIEIVHPWGWDISDMTTLQFFSLLQQGTGAPGWKGGGVGLVFKKAETTMTIRRGDC